MKRFVLLAATMAIAAPALALPVKIMFSTVAGSPTRAVPGSPGFFWLTSTSTLGRVQGSPDGRRFSVTGLAEFAGDNRDTMVVGEVANPASWQTLLMEDTPFAGISGQTVGNVRSVCSMLNDGRMGIAMGTNEASTANDYLFSYTPGSPATWNQVIKEGTASTLFAGNNLTTLAAPNLDTASVLHYQVGGNSSTNPGGWAKAGVGMLMSRGVTVPTGALNAINDTVNLHENDAFRKSPNSDAALGWVRLGTVTTQDSAVLAWNGTSFRTVAREGFALPGASDTTSVASFSTVALSPSSVNVDRKYAFRGSLTGGRDFIAFGSATGLNQFVFNGDPIVPGSTETWNDASSFGSVALHGGFLNNVNEKVIFGFTDAPAASNFVIVYDNGYTRKVVAREGDAIDLDGNGNAGDDDTFLNQVVSDNGHLGDNCRLLIGPTIRNGAGTVFNIAAAYIDLPIPGDISGDDEVGPGDLQTVLDNFGNPASAAPDADIDADGEIGPGDLQAVLDNFGRSR